jgi:hypothetical protein
VDQTKVRFGSKADMPCDSGVQMVGAKTHHPHASRALAPVPPPGFFFIAWLKRPRTKNKGPLGDWRSPRGPVSGARRRPHRKGAAPLHIKWGMKPTCGGVPARLRCEPRFYTSALFGRCRRIVSAMMTSTAEQHIAVLTHRGRGHWRAGYEAKRPWLFNHPSMEFSFGNDTTIFCGSLSASYATESGLLRAWFAFSPASARRHLE